MPSEQNDRIAIVMAATSIGVTLTSGETLVTLRMPRTQGAGEGALDDAQVRSAALRSAKLALEVALEEVSASIG